MSDFIVIDNKKEVKSPEDFLLNNNYYKSYSLLLAHTNNITILDTLILASSDSIDVLENYLNCFPNPIMLRMDYASLQGSKFIGGIPVNTVSALRKLCLFLFDNGYIPVLQTYTNRFENQYSFGCLITNKDDEIIIEFVGKGFDAGDLRLNLTNPHQKISYDYTNWKILSNEIKYDEYLNAKAERELYIGKMESYFKYVNTDNKLLLGKDLDLLKGENSKKLNDKYIPVTKNEIDEAAFLSYIIKTKVIPFLPFSQDYIASFSILENKECVLWDIYGKWYQR
jgi:hypothetical protein